jgi:hypothetical protein
MNRVGHYELLEPIGKGGMGVVHRARDSRLGRVVALKLLPDAASSDPARRARFLTEARACAALLHPNIATLFEFGEAEQPDGPPRLFLAMEYVEGEDLSAVLAAGPVPMGQALGIGRQLASALVAAHRHGVIHRDLKPGNVRLAPGGEVKVLDFGLAKLAASGDATVADGFHTREGVLMGTPPYLAPEQARGQKVDERADLYSARRDPVRDAHRPPPVEVPGLRPVPPRARVERPGRHAEPGAGRGAAAGDAGRAAPAQGAGGPSAVRRGGGEGAGLARGFVVGDDRGGDRRARPTGAAAGEPGPIDLLDPPRAGRARRIARRPLRRRDRAAPAARPPAAERGRPAGAGGGALRQPHRRPRARLRGARHEPRPVGRTSPTWRTPTWSTRRSPRPTPHDLRPGSSSAGSPPTTASTSWCGGACSARARACWSASTWSTWSPAGWRGRAQFEGEAGELLALQEMRWCAASAPGCATGCRASSRARLEGGAGADALQRGVRGPPAGAAVRRGSRLEPGRPGGGDPLLRARARAGPPVRVSLGSSWPRRCSTCSPRVGTLRCCSARVSEAEHAFAATTRPGRRPAGARPRAASLGRAGSRP